MFIMLRRFLIFFVIWIFVVTFWLVWVTLPMAALTAGLLSDDFQQAVKLLNSDLDGMKKNLPPVK